MEVGKAGRTQKEGSLTVAGQDQGAGGNDPGRAGGDLTFDCPQSHQDEELNGATLKSDMA